MKNISYERYVETFHVLEKYSEEYGYQLEHLLKEMEGLKGGFSALDIGAGTGQFARSFLERSRTKARSYTAIEPSEGHIEMIKANLASFPGDKDIIKAKFTPETRFDKKFDLIVMSHSVYWFVPNIGEHLMNAVRALDEKGRLVIYMQTFATFSYILNCFLRASDPIYPHRISSREVTQILEENKIRYDLFYLPGTLKAEEVLSTGNKKLLLELISFCLFSEAKELSKRDLKFAEDLLTLLSCKTNEGLKLNLTLAAITIIK